MTASQRWLRDSVVAIVIVHFVVAIWHGVAYMDVPVPLSQSQDAFVIVVVLALPLVGAALLWTKWKRAAALLIALSMLGALIFGYVNHFVRESPDYVLEVPAHAWRHSFIVSAALVAITEAIGFTMGAVAAAAWWCVRETPE